MMLALAMTVVFLSGVPVTVAAIESAPPNPAEIRVTPDSVAISTFFDGTTLKVSGVAPTDMNLAVLVTGDRETVKLKKKGKVWGFLWMNVGDVSFERVPSVYFLASSSDVCELAPYAERQRLGMGVDVLGDTVVTDGDPEARRLFEEFVKLKRMAQLYASFEGSIDQTPAGDGGIAFATDVPVPAAVAPGIYRVSLWGFRGGQGVELADTSVTVATVGLTRDVGNLARTHGTLYGILALVVALVVGLVTGLVFGLASKGGH